MGTRGKDGKFILLFLQNGALTMAGVYAGVVGQHENFLGYGFDYLPESIR